MNVYESPVNFIKLHLNPSHDKCHDEINLFAVQRPALCKTMPLLNASTATGRGGMLGNEHRMSAHRGLLAVIVGKIRGNSCTHKLKSVLPDGLQVFLRDVRAVF